jgi:hypothetical protein
VSQDHERVEPAPFDAAPAAESPAPSTERSGLPPWRLPALVVLVALALLVVFWLPGRIAAPPQPPATAEENGAAPPSAPAASTGEQTGPERNPYAEAQAARLRGEAQDILAELLDARENLLDRGVERWGADALAAIDELAASGDERYRERAYETAIERYREALQQAVDLEGRLPAELAAQHEAAVAAIEAGEVAAADAAVALAETIEPGLARTAALRERAAALPAVVEQLEAAAVAEAADDLATARQALAAAAAADPAHERVAAELARVSAALEQRRFTDAMSAGYAALAAENFSTAREAFSRAGKLAPGSAEAAAGLAEVAAAETAARLRELRRTAENAAAAEDWTQAVARFEEALALDASVLFAQRGLAQARSRAALDEALAKALEEPDRYADPAVAEDAAALLERARRTARDAATANPRLAEQVDELERILARANTEVTVTLRSDGKTTVTVYRVARLGTFEEQTLALRPGEYTAVGTRPGYRDVRRTFRVAPEDPPGPITVSCTEEI